ncbi:hypothetical protein [Asaia astilbis]|uniref:hypothetical protein n=1 Tax=Asaia astilbis TaxID=610244 RepID=UPI001E377B05|nr:hypothetical protein [Asaia astilbis]
MTASPHAQAETAALLSQALDARPSATLVLQDYCQHKFPGIAIRAVTLPVGNTPPPPPDIALFALKKGETIRTRHVSLRCGEIALSDAWNWYVPQRVTTEMNRILERSTKPFGLVVASLNFKRLSLSSETRDLPDTILVRNQALLERGKDGLPFSLVEENYLSDGFSRLNGDPD